MAILTVGSCRRFSSQVATDPVDSVANNRNFKAEPPFRKKWLDRNESLATRVKSFLDMPHLRPADVSGESSVVFHLIRNACRLNTMEGMQWGHDMVERLIIGKRRLVAQNARVETKDGVQQVVVPIEIWDLLMYGWAVLAPKHRVALVRMQEILERVEEEALWDEAVRSRILSQNVDANSKDNTQTWTRMQHLPSSPKVDIFNTYLYGISNASKLSRSAATRGEQLVDVMNQWSDHHGWFCRPNSKSYMHIITAYSNSGHPQAGLAALRILKKIKHVHEEEKERYEHQFNQPYDDENPKRNRRRIVTADAITYSATIKALLNSAVVQPNNSSSIKFIDKAITVFQEALDDKRVDMDAHMVVTAIHAFGKMADKGRTRGVRIKAAQQAEDILCMMIENSNLSSSTAARPNADEVEREGCPASRDISRSSIRVAPDSLTVAFNACLDAWSRAYVPEAPLRCESILQTMISDENEDESTIYVVPDVVSFNSCLYAWSKSTSFHRDAARRAEELLERQHALMTHLSRRYCEKDIGSRRLLNVKPDFQSYALVILSHANSRAVDKIQNARRILDIMISRLKTNEVQLSRNPTAPFSAVLIAIAKSKPKSEQHTARQNSELTTEQSVEDPFEVLASLEHDAYSIALRTFKEVVNDAYGVGSTPDQHLYGAMLRCIACHCPAGTTERRQRATAIFNAACESGHVGRVVVDSLIDALGEDALHHFKVSQPDQMPRFWSRNVPASFRYNAKNRRQAP